MITAGEVNRLNSLCVFLPTIVFTSPAITKRRNNGRLTMNCVFFPSFVPIISNIYKMAGGVNRLDFSCVFLHLVVFTSSAITKGGHNGMFGFF